MDVRTIRRALAPLLVLAALSCPADADRRCRQSDGDAISSPMRDAVTHGG